MWLIVGMESVAHLILRGIVTHLPNINMHYSGNSSDKQCFVHLDFYKLIILSKR